VLSIVLSFMPIYW